MPAGTLMLAVKFIVVSALALLVGGYNNWVVGSIRGLEDGLAAMFAGTNHAGEPMTVYATIETTLGKGWDIPTKLWERASNRGLTQIRMATSTSMQSSASATLVVASVTAK